MLLLLKTQVMHDKSKIKLRYMHTHVTEPSNYCTPRPVMEGKPGLFNL